MTKTVVTLSEVATIDQVSPRKARDWYAERGDKWWFIGTKWAYYGVQVESELVGLCGITTARLYDKFEPSEEEWPLVLRKLKRPSKQRYLSSSGFREQLPYVTGVEVDEKHRGNGYGKAMMKLFLTLAAQTGKPYAMLCVDSATPAYHLYRGLGFFDLCAAYTETKVPDRLMLKRINKD